MVPSYWVTEFISKKLIAPLQYPKMMKQEPRLVLRRKLFLILAVILLALDISVSLVRNASDKLELDSTMSQSRIEF